uniref:Peptide-methionine (R)-S-oxide reductase n=2 Tax=Neospora caninum (strain Liverpool) TaxID=572307 RepID=A0A0F7UIY7_NEOCL|nr:TPA: AT4G21860 protein, related [Neospora caninum Liverpool]
MPSCIPSIGSRVVSLFRSIPSPHAERIPADGNAASPETKSARERGSSKRRWHSSSSSSTTVSGRMISSSPLQSAMSIMPPEDSMKTEVSPFPAAKTDAQWKVLLTPEQFRILRKKGTEAPGTGYYNKVFPTKGYFACAACRHPLYPASAKFAAGCGWPAFDCFFKGSVHMQPDTSLGMKRVEIVCANCGGHLGHLFEGEGFTQTNERHCVNSVSIRYIADAKPAPPSAVTTYKLERARQAQPK